MKLHRSLPAALVSMLPGMALAQSGYLAPDGKNRFPGVTIFCPNGTGVTPCSFGGGGATGAVSLTQGGAAVSASNRLPVVDAQLDALIVGGALSVSGMVGLAGTPTVSLGAGTLSVGGVTQSGNWIVGLAPGSSVSGTVAVSNLPATQPVSGAISQAGTWTVGLAAGANTIGSVAVSNLPATQPISGAVSQAGTWTMGLATGTNAIGSVAVSNLPVTQPISGAVSQAGTWTIGLATGTNAIGSVAVSNLPATQPVSEVSLPLPAGAATAAGQSAALGPVAPGAATAAGAVVLGCLSNTTLPSFAAGQEGAVPCDSSGRPYVVTVPSGNNVPSYLQAVTSGGASSFRALNVAASTMAASVKATSGMIYGYEACNSGASSAYLRLFAQAAAPVVGTSIPVVTKLLPPTSCQGFSNPVGVMFAGGIGIDVTSGTMADADTTAVASANQVSVEVYYK